MMSSIGFTVIIEPMIVILLTMDVRSFFFLLRVEFTLDTRRQEVILACQM